MEWIEMIVVPATKQSPRNTEADIVELSGGRVLLAWSEFWKDTGGDHDTARIRGKISSDQGRTWSEPYTLVDGSEARLNNVMEPDLQRLPSGELLLLYLFKNSARDSGIAVRRSSDDGKTWSGPDPVTSDDRVYHCTTNARSIRMRSGRLVMPVEVRGVCYSYFSDDDGHTWKHGLPPIRGADEPAMYEPAVAELRNGDLLMYLRNDTGLIWQSLSYDSGHTWSVAYPTSLAASGAPQSLRRVGRSDDLLVIWSQTTQKEIDHGLERCRLSCALSKDDGKTWECFNNFESLDDKTRVDPPPAFLPARRAEAGWQIADAYPVVPRGYLSCSYPSCTFIDDLAYITYWVAPAPYTALKLRVLPVEWFYKEHGWSVDESAVEVAGFITSGRYKDNPEG